MPAIIEATHDAAPTCAALVVEAFQVFVPSVPVPRPQNQRAILWSPFPRKLSPPSKRTMAFCWFPDRDGGAWFCGQTRSSLKLRMQITHVPGFLASGLNLYLSQAFLPEIHSISPGQATSGSKMRRYRSHEPLPSPAEPCSMVPSPAGGKSKSCQT